jgi:hypothetical protein
MFANLMHVCEVINKVRFVSEFVNHNSITQHKVGLCDVQIGCHQPKVDNAFGPFDMPTTLTTIKCLHNTTLDVVIDSANGEHGEQSNDMF